MPERLLDCGCREDADTQVKLEFCHPHAYAELERQDTLCPAEHQGRLCGLLAGHEGTGFSGPAHRFNRPADNLPHPSRRLDFDIARYVFQLAMRTVLPSNYDRAVYLFIDPSFPSFTAYSYDSNACNFMPYRKTGDPSHGLSIPLPHYSTERFKDVIDQMRSRGFGWSFGTTSSREGKAGWYARCFSLPDNAPRPDVLQSIHVHKDLEIAVANAAVNVARDWWEHEVEFQKALVDYCVKQELSNTPINCKHCLLPITDGHKRGWYHIDTNIAACASKSTLAEP